MKSHRVFLAACVVLTELHTGCATGPRPVPSWAMHVKPPKIDTSATVSDLTTRISGELKAEYIYPGYLPAEQIAALAIKEIRSGRGWDGAVLLSLASYRYHQQAIYAVERSSKIPRNIRIDNNVYTDFVKNEVYTFNDLDFDEELDYLSGVLQRDEALTEKYQKAFWNLLRVAEAKRESMSKQILTQIEQQYTAPPEIVQNKRVAKQLLMRLEEDIDVDHNRYFASLYLASTPLGDYLETAFRKSIRPFNPVMCRKIAPRLSIYRELVSSGLADGNPMTRSNSAVVLGLRPSEDNVESLENRMGIETDEKVRLSLSYALIMHGKREYLANIDSAITNCADENSTCDHAIHLTQWLPQETKVGVDQLKMASILKNKSNTPFSRFFALKILEDIGREKNLSKKAVSALLDTTVEKSEGFGLNLAEFATATIASLNQLTSADVYEGLNSNRRYSTALFNRFAAVTTSEDLAFLVREYEKFNLKPYEEKAAIVAAVANIPGKEPNDLLIRCYREHPETRFLVAILLVQRGETRANVFEELAAKGRDPGALILKLKTESKDAAPLASQLILKGEPQQRIQAAYIVTTYKKYDLIPDLWQMAEYAHPGYYPKDAYVRHAALQAILRLELGRAENLSGENWTGLKPSE